jgi:predicted transcriptional regulator
MAKSTSVKLKEGYSERLKSLAEAKQRSANWLLNDAVGKYLEYEETEAEFRAEALRRVKEFQETGLHVTNEEAMDWLLRRSRGENVPPPKAHR